MATILEEIGKQMESEENVEVIEPDKDDELGNTNELRNESGKNDESSEKIEEKTNAEPNKEENLTIIKPPKNIKMTQVCLSENDRDIAKKIGNGKISKGIRLALKEYSV
jgi:hypothetical protein